MLRKKMLRDFWQHKAQFFSIFLMCFLSMYIYSGIYAEWKGMEEITDTYYEDSNFADAWLINDVKDGSYLDGVSSVAAYEGRTRLPASDANVSDSVLDLYVVEDAKISSFIVLEGKPYDPTSTGIWLDQMYAQANDLQVGDILSLSVSGNISEEEIQGLIWQPEYVYALKDATTMLPDHLTYGFAFIAKAANPKFQQLPYNQIVIKENKSSEKLKETLEEVTMDRSIQIIDRESHASYQTMQEEIDQHRSIGTLFPIVFLLIAMLTTLNTMNKIIVNQRTQIGTLKALGFTKRTLYLHYMSHILLLCLLGNLLGLLLGPITIPDMIYEMQKTMYFLPIWEGRLNRVVWILALISCIICVAACMIATHKEVKECAASVMRPRMLHVSGRQTFSKTRLWRCFSFYTQWNLRDMVRNKARFIMAIIGIMGCSALLVCSLGLQDSIAHMIDWQYEKLHTYEHKILLDEKAQMQDILILKQQADGSTIQEGFVTLQTDEKKMVPLLVLEDTRFIKLDEKSDPSLPDDGVVIAKKLADEVGLQIGDEIHWQLDSAWHTSRIAMVKRVPLSQGIIMSAKVFEQQEVYQPTAMLCNSTPIPSSSIVLTTQNRSDLQADMDVMLEAMQVIIMVLILAAALLGIVVLYNFTSLSFFERTREMATLKVLGFTNQNIKKIMVAQNMQLAILGIALGLPFGYAMVCFMSRTLSEGMDLVVMISWRSYLIAIGSTLLLTYGISRWMAKKAGGIDMVSALKAVE